MAYVTPLPSVEKGQSAPVPNQRARWSYLNGSDVCQNPYEPGSPEALAWMANWFQEKQDLEESVLALCHEKERLGR